MECFVLLGIQLRLAFGGVGDILFPSAYRIWLFAAHTLSLIHISVIGFSPAEIKFCHTAEDRIDLAMLKKGIAGNLAIAKKLADQPK